MLALPAEAAAGKTAQRSLTDTEGFPKTPQLHALNYLSARLLRGISGHRICGIRACLTAAQAMSVL